MVLLQNEFNGEMVKLYLCFNISSSSSVHGKPLAGLSTALHIIEGRHSQMFPFLVFRFEYARDSHWSQKFTTSQLPYKKKRNT